MVHKRRKSTTPQMMPVEVINQIFDSTHMGRDSLTSQVTHLFLEKGIQQLKILLSPVLRASIINQEAE